MKEAPNLPSRIARVVRATFEDFAEIQVNGFAAIGKLLLDRSPRSILSPRGILWTWDTIKGFGDARIWKSSYLFLFLVPVVARAMSRFPEFITVPYLNYNYELHLKLPFSWTVLFFSALFASIGNAIYLLRCPRIVGDFPDYPVFQQSGRDYRYLIPTLVGLSGLSRDAMVEDHVDDVSNVYLAEKEYPKSIVRCLESSAEVIPEAFYFVRDAANLSRPIARLIASLMYLCAFVGFAILALQNLHFVILYLIQSHHVIPTAAVR